MRRALPRLPILLLLLLLLLLNTTYHKYYFYYCYSLLPTTVNAATTTPTATTKIHCTAYVALDSIFNCYTKWTFSHRNDQRVGPSCGSEVQTEIIPNRQPPAETMGVMRNVILFLCLLSLGNGQLAPRFNRQPDGSIRSVIAGNKWDCFVPAI